MKKLIGICKRKILCFRRWSRKSYGAFVSIGAYVTIAPLAKGIVDALLKKSGMQDTMLYFALGTDALLQNQEIPGPTGPPPVQPAVVFPAICQIVFFAQETAGMAASGILLYIVL